MERIVCPKGHLLGLIVDGNVLIKHMGRKIEISIPEEVPLRMCVCCDRCGEKKLLEIRK